MWKKHSGELDKYCGEMPNIEYAITDELLKKVKTYKNVDDFKCKNDLSYDIIRVYKLYDNELKCVHIGYAKNTLYNALVCELYYALESKSNARVNEYVSKNIKLTDVAIKLLRIYRTKKSTNIISEMNKIKKSFDETTNETTSIKSKSKFDAQKYLSELTDCDELTEKKYYLQKIYSKTKPDSVHIFGGFNKMKSSDCAQYVKDKCIELCDDKLKVEVISEHLIKYETEGMIIVDKFILENDSIASLDVLIGDDGAIKKRVFMMVQCEKMVANMKNKKYGEKYYVACIGNKDKNFIFTGTGNVSKKLSEFYSMVHHNEESYDSLIEFLSTNEWEHIVVKCIEQNIDVGDIEQKKIEIMNKFEKSALMNYCSDECNDKYATKKDLEKMKGTCFSILKRK